MLAQMPRPIPAAALTAMLILTSPAVAQEMAAKDAWAGLRAIMAGAGLTITSSGASDFGTSYAATGVRIFATDDPDSVVVSMDELRIEPRGDLVALIPSSVVHVVSRLSGDEIREFDITHDGEIRGMLTQTDAALDLDFGTLSAVLTRSERAGQPQDERLQSQVTDFDATLRANRDGTVDLSISALSATYDVVSMDHSMGEPMRFEASGSVDAPQITFSGTELDMLSGDPGMLAQAFAGGLSAHLTMSSGASNGASSQMIDGVPVRMVTDSNGSSLTATLVDGRFDADVSSGGGEIQAAYGPIEGNATFDGLGLALGLPLVVTPEDQPMRYAFHFDNVAPSPELVTMLGAGPFAGDSVTLAVDLGAMGRLTQELGPDVGESDVPPFDISEITLSDLRLAVGDSEFTGTGAVTLIGGLLAQIGRERPEANGDFVFNLIGGERLLGRLQTMGVVPNDQLFFVRMMMNGLGRPVGEDHLQSEVALRPGGAVTVNGMPLPF